VGQLYLKRYRLVFYGIDSNGKNKPLQRQQSSSNDSSAGATNEIIRRNSGRKTVVKLEPGDLDQSLVRRSSTSMKTQNTEIDSVGIEDFQKPEEKSSENEQQMKDIRI